jgi:hypothetical protein
VRPSNEYADRATRTFETLKPSSGGVKSYKKKGSEENSKKVPLMSASRDDDEDDKL